MTELDLKEAINEAFLRGVDHGLKMADDLINNKSAAGPIEDAFNGMWLEDVADGKPEYPAIYKCKISITG